MSAISSSSSGRSMNTLPFALPAHSRRTCKQFSGFLETDLGMGLVCACVRTRDGALAPTLKEIIDAGTFDENARDPPGGVLRLATRVADRCRRPEYRKHRLRPSSVLREIFSFWSTASGTRTSSLSVPSVGG